MLRRDSCLQPVWYIGTRANQSSDYSRREKDWLYTELEERERALLETRIGTLQEMIELRKFCCTEAERAQQLTTDELSRRE